MITPNPFGVILFTSLFNLSFSFESSIFCEIEILDENGTRTKNLPAKEISDVTLGPLVEIGSLTICIKIGSFVFMTSEIEPSLLISSLNL